MVCHYLDEATLTWPIMTSSNGNFYRDTGHFCGEFTGHRWIPHTRAVTRSFDVLFDLHMNKRSSKQSWGWWIETPLCSLWRHCSAIRVICVSLTFTGAVGEVNRWVSVRSLHYFDDLRIQRKYIFIERICLQQLLEYKYHYIQTTIPVVSWFVSRAFKYHGIVLEVVSITGNKKTYSFE